MMTIAGLCYRVSINFIPWVLLNDFLSSGNKFRIINNEIILLFLTYG